MCKASFYFELEEKKQKESQGQKEKVQFGENLQIYIYIFFNCILLTVNKILQVHLFWESRSMHIAFLISMPGFPLLNFIVSLSKA